MCTIIISKLLGSVVAPWRPLLAQTTRLPCPDQQAQTQAQAQAWVRMQPPLQLRASWQPTSAVQHARSFWRPSRPWAATWTCGACRSYPCVNEAWRQSSRQEDEEDRRESEREREREREGEEEGGRERERERENQQQQRSEWENVTLASAFAAEGCTPGLSCRHCDQIMLLAHDQRGQKEYSISKCGAVTRGDRRAPTPASPPVPSLLAGCRAAHFFLARQDLLPGRVTNQSSALERPCCSRPLRPTVANEAVNS